MASHSTTITKCRRRAAGIDIGSREHWVCIDPELTDRHVRCFPSFTEDLEALVAWLRSHGIETVAMEATGIYWRELFMRLEEAGIEALLVDPRQTRHPRGRKTDMQDCCWIWELHAHGLLNGAFVPGPAIQTLRTYLRFRSARIDRCGEALKEVQRALSMMNIQLQHVLRDVAGTTGSRIITAILDGERDPEALAAMRDGRCRRDQATIAKALCGSWRTEYLFLLREAWRDYQTQRETMARCDEAIAELLDTFPVIGVDEAEGVTRKRATGKHRFRFDAQTIVYRLTGADLASIDGIGPTTALKLIGEIGCDVGAFPSSKDFCGWLGLCPNPKRTGGKQIGTMPSSANRAARILRDAALGLDGKRGPIATYLARLAARKGKNAALKATAHKLARIVYAALRDGSTYDPDKLTPKPTAKSQRRRLQRLAKSAQELGYEIVPADP